MSHEAYVRNMQKYLRDGDWIDLFYGEHQDRIHKNIIGLEQSWDGLMLELTIQLLGTVYSQKCMTQII